MEPKIIDTGIDAFYCDELEGPAPYFARATPVPSKPGCWNVNKMEVIERATNNVVGEYTYTYSSAMRTFHPFKLRGNWYALYSKHYTATRVMSLPDCKDLGGEDPDGCGFCPVDFYVPGLHYIETVHLDNCPRNKKVGKPDFSKACICNPTHEPTCSYLTKKNASCDCNCRKEFWKWHHIWHFPDRVHGFVAGCVWGDDSSWKIQYLDLSRADEGIIKRSEKFGYIELPANLTLNKAISLELNEPGGDDDFTLRIATESYYDFTTGEKNA